jgi:hypothetical protein
MQSTMKKINTFLFTAAIMSLLLVTSCKKSDDPQPETDRVTGLLKANTWKIQSVTVNSTDQTDLFTGLTLSFTDINYTTTKGSVVWPANGTWTFTDDTAKKILRSDDIEVTIMEITDTSLKLSLNWDTGTFGPGRTSSIAGNHVFSFVK